MDHAEVFGSRILVDDAAITQVDGPPGAPRIFVVDDFLAPQMHADLLSLFDNERYWTERFGIFRRKAPGAATGPEVGREEWLATAPERRFFHYRALTPDVSRSDFSPAWATWIMFWLRMADRRVPDWLARRTLTPIVRPAVELTAIALGRGHYQHLHDDNLGSRRLCGALYLSRGWQPQFGGEFEFVVGGDEPRRVAPLANRLVLFDPREKSADGRKPKHHMLPLGDAAGDWQRRSVSLWWKEDAT